MKNKTLHILAVKKGLVSPALREPDLYKYKVETYHHSFLLPEELKLIEDYDSKKLPHQWEAVRDAFLFSCYTGLRFSDISRITPQHILQRGDVHWLIMKTQKTGVEIRLPLEHLFEGKAVYIYNKVKEKAGLYLFQLGTNTAANKVLQRIAKRAGISTHVSFHTARHSLLPTMLTTTTRLLPH